MSAAAAPPLEGRSRRTVVLGDGAWGTALALCLVKQGIETVLWSAFPEQSEQMRRTRENRRFLPGVELPAELELTADPFPACEGVDLAISVVPAQYLREVAERFEDALPGKVPIATATKGLEMETLKRPTQILEDVFGERPLCVLTGPSHAEEVARGLPASVVAASSDGDLARAIQITLTSDSFRVYTSEDPVGAELGGALKNVIALAAGISDGLGLGDNAKAALLTRGMMEMARYGMLQGAKASTFFGLAGIGDLVTTCCSKHSRNRAVGEAIGRGERLPQILEGMSAVAEGVWTTKALFGPEGELGGIEMPIAAEVHAVLFEDKDAREAVLDLMRREPVSEMSRLR